MLRAGMGPSCWEECDDGADLSAENEETPEGRGNRPGCAAFKDSVYLLMRYTNKVLLFFFLNHREFSATESEKSVFVFNVLPLLCFFLILRLNPAA